jgi:hypothetical protein
MRSVGVKQSMDHTAIELTGSERLAAVMQVTDEETGHQKFAYRFFQFWASKTDPKPNRNRSVWAGFGSGLFVFFLWFGCFLWVKTEPNRK